MVKREANLHEGDFFLVPLRDDCYGLGLAAQVLRSEITLGFFFHEMKKDAPSLQDLTTLSVKDTILVRKFGDIHLRNGSWPVIGKHPNWNRSAWQVAGFGRHELLSDRKWRDEYNDNDIGNFIKAVRITDDEYQNLPRNVLSGSGALKITLEKLLR